MTMTTTTYTIRDYTTGSAIGEVEMDAKQYAAYERMSQQPEGIMPKSELVSLGAEITWSDVPTTDCTVYLD
jgi:hypothetical protein